MPGRLIKMVPNALSALRLALAIAFPFLPAHWRLTAVLVGAVSDWLDGLIARRYRAITAAGVLLDAIADKVFTASVLVTLIAVGEMMWWQGLIVLCRDMVVAMIAAYALLIRRMDAFRHMRPRLPGKAATTLVLIWLVAMLAGAGSALERALFALAAGASVLAGADYFLQFLRRPAELRGRGGRAPASASQ